MSWEALYKFVLPKYKLVQTEALYAFYWRQNIGPGSGVLALRMNQPIIQY